MLARASLAMMLILSVSGCSEFAAEFSAKSKKASGGAVTGNCDPSATPFGGVSNGYQLICAEEQLKLIGSKSFHVSSKFALASDITLTSTNFSPLFSQVKFDGVFDGNGHTIRNFQFSKPTDQSGTLTAGLFGTLGVNGQIKNLNLDGVSVAGTNSVGSLVGTNYGLIDSVVVKNASVEGSGSVGGIAGSNNGGTISNVFFSGNVVGQFNAGGLVGVNSTDVTGLIGGTIIKSASQGFVLSNANVAGIAAQSSAGCTIDQVYSTSDVTLSMINAYGTFVSMGAGIVAYNSGTVTNSFYAGSIVADGDGYQAGGIVSQNQAPSVVSGNYSAASVISGTVSLDPTYSAAVSADDYNPAGTTANYYYNLSGMIAQNNGYDMFGSKIIPMDITARTLAEMKVQGNFVFDFSKWRMGSGAYAFPVLQWQSVSDPFNAAQGGSTPAISSHSVLKMVDGATAMGYSFDSAIVGATSTNSVTVTNKGTGAVRLGAVSMFIGRQFSNLGTGSCVSGNLLASGASCTINLKFTAADVGLIFDGVSIAYTQGGKSYRAAHMLTAIGDLSPAAFIYAQGGTPSDTYVNSAGTFSTFVYQRTGGDTSTIDSVTVQSDNGEYAVSADGCTNQTLVGDYSFCQIDMTFSPTVVGYYLGKLTINYHTSSGSSAVETIRFGGTAIPPLLPYGSGTVADPYQIKSEADFNIAANHPSLHYIQMVDLDSASTALSNIKFLSGSYNGNSHTIANLTNPFSDYCATNSTVKNLVITNANIVDNRLNTVVGILCSKNYGLIQNVAVTGSITAPASEAVGGIVGEDEKDGVIKDSISNVTVVGKDRVGGVVGAFGVWSPGNNYAQNTYSYGSVTGETYVGGFTGAVANGANVYDCGNFATVNGVTWTGGFTGLHYLVDLNRIFNVGNVTGTGDKTGGLVGFNIGDATSTGFLVQSFNAGNVTGTTSVGGLIGENLDATSGATDSFSSGIIFGTGGVGGLVGKVDAGVFTRNLVVATSVTGGAPVSDVFGAGTPSSALENYYLNSTAYNDVYATKLTPAEVNSAAKFVGFDFVTPVWRSTSSNAYAPTLSVFPAWACSNAQLSSGLTCL